MKVKNVKVVLKITCGECGKKNYINKGNYEDFIVGEDQGLSCWFCGDKQWLTKDAQTLNKVDIWFEQGLKRP
jgi:hypothetical protein